MKAIVRRYSRSKWVAVEVATNPLTATIEGADGSDAEKNWLNDLPTALVDGKSVSIHENPEGWLTTMSNMPYTRFSVEILET